MKTITIVAYNRLNYLEAMLASLLDNDLSGYNIFIGVEPDDRGVVDFCLMLNLPCAQVTVNRTRLGVSGNPFATISRAFWAGSTMNVHLEDDLILAPDALALVDWYYSMKKDPWFCLSLFNYDSDPARPELVEEADHFAPLGWAIKHEMWHAHLEHNWTSDARGWDFSVNKTLAETKLRLLRPSWSRANHIGREGGTHCTSEFHDRVFSRLSISTGDHRNYLLHSN